MGWYLTFSKILYKLMTRLKQYMMSPTPVRQISASWKSHSSSPSPVDPLTPGSVGFRGRLLYQETADGAAQGMTEVKKLSKVSASAADHAQINTTSTRVWASLADVRQSPKGRPKYST